MAVVTAPGTVERVIAASDNLIEAGKTYDIVITNTGNAATADDVFETTVNPSLGLITFNEAGARFMEVPSGDVLARLLGNGATYP